MRAVARNAERVAGSQLEFLPIAVNGQPFSIMRVLPVLDALDLDRSDVRYDAGADTIKAIDRPVWRGDRLTNPLMFRIPQTPTELFATDGIRQAHDTSGCTGLTFWHPGDVV